jgi:hypothetical protein
MHWMVRWPGGFPIFASDASGARFSDVDGMEPRPARPARRHDAGGRVERRRGPRARAAARRRRVRPGRAGADEHRDRPPGAGLPRRPPDTHARDRDAPDRGRDPHSVRGARRLHGRARAGAGPADRREGDRKRDRGRGVRVQRGGRAPSRGGDRPRRVGRRRSRRHARCERALARGGAGHARARAHGRGVCPEDRARRALQER